MRGGVISGCVLGHNGMHGEDADDRADAGADDCDIQREPGGDYGRDKHDAELDDYGSNECNRDAGELFVEFGRWIFAGNADGDNDVYADGDEHDGDSHQYSDDYGDAAEFADDQLFCSEPDGRDAGRGEHVELGDDGRDDSDDYSGDVQFDVGERIDECEPRRDNHIRFDGDKCGRVGDGIGAGDRAGAGVAGDQLIHGESAEYHGGGQHITELVGNGSYGYCDHAGNIYVDIGERFDFSESNGNDDVYADGEQCGGIEYCDGKCDGECRGRRAEDCDDELPRGNAGRGLCRLHDCGDGWDAIVYVFGERERELCSAAGGDGAGGVDRRDQQRADRRPGNLCAADCGDGLKECSGDAEH